MSQRRKSNSDMPVFSSSSHHPHGLPHHSGSGGHPKRAFFVPRGFSTIGKLLVGALLLAVVGYWMLEEPRQIPTPSRVAEAVSAAVGSAKSALTSSEACPNPHPDRPAFQYMLMLDAGSTGSRIHIYRFNYCHGPSPSLENEIFEQLKPGLSHTKFVTPKDAADSLDPLLKLAMEHVPEDARKCTPVSVKATAGLRMLKDGKGDRILEAVAEKLRTEYPFPLVEPGGVEIMPGKDEGVYAWITVNYLLKRIGQKAREPTAAVMDLGGGSTQIVFEPHQEEPMEEGDHKFEVPFGDHTYTLYQHSYDGYGLMQGRKRIKEAGVLDKTHPCYAVGHSESYTGDDGQVHAIAGTGGDHGLCHKFITNLFDKQTCPVPNRPVSPSRVSSSTSQCSFNGIYQPSLSSSFANSDIYAFSYFYDKFAEPFGKLSDKGFSVGQLRAAAEAVCSGQTVMDDASLTDGERAAAELLKADPEWCTDLGFMYGLLSVGYEIPDERVLKTAKKIDGVEVGWSLGAALKVVDTWGTEGKGHCLKEIVS